MNKKLNISAIIPKELYVQRDADRKLKEVIQLMSKPAYISVSRQMGKTNLLINTKRELQNENNRYIFIDITGSFTSSQECFRYIINQILDSNEDIEAFETASQIINEKRKESLSRSSTEEYQSEIRTILKHFKGNLIIFLDEVDDLVKHSFSDELFGQIRKTYFIRETYDVLKRITYVLSGVIDPEKLIKSKENSPFNIAIPIYLQDFTYCEFDEFVVNSELPITKQVREHIYNWLSGNPRMTFDVLSQIEDEYISGKDITKPLVDEVIQTIYLDSYKQPPVDHIRDLVKHDTEARKALISLKKGVLSELSDASINKLFLFGVINSKIRNSVAIKNKVIEHCLSDDWLSKVELEKNGYYDYGIDKIKQGLYEDGIFYLKEYIANSPSAAFVSLAEYSIGESYFKLKNYNEAISYLSQKPIKKESSLKLYYTQIFYLATSYFRNRVLKESEEIYDEIIANCEDINTVISALINKAEIVFVSKIKDYETVISIYQSILTKIEQQNDNISDHDNILAIAYYRIGCSYYELKKKEEALPNFNKSLDFADVKYTPEILLYIDSCLDEDRSDRDLHFINIANIIIENKITFKINENSIIQFPEYHLQLCLLNLFEWEKYDVYEKLLEYSINEIYENKINISDLIYQVALSAYSWKEEKVGAKLLIHILDRENTSLVLRKECYFLLAMLPLNGNNAEVFKEPNLSYLFKYIELFKLNKNFGKTVELSDVNAFLNAITYYRGKKKLKESLDLASIISEYYNDELSNDSKAAFVFVYFFMVDYYSFIGDLKNIQIYGDKALEIISKINPILNELSYIDKQSLTDVAQKIRSLLDKGERIKKIEPIKSDRRIGRNEYVTVKYKDGRTTTLKFKKVENDIESGKCVIDED